MQNRFEHLKKKRRPTREEFIEGANYDSPLVVAKKQYKKEDILLSITGRGNMDEYAKPSLLYIKKDLDESIQKHCVGSKQAIINYLLKLGLNTLKEKGEFVIEQHY